MCFLQMQSQKSRRQKHQKGDSFNLNHYMSNLQPLFSGSINSKLGDTGISGFKPINRIFHIPETEIVKIPLFVAPGTLLKRWRVLPLGVQQVPGSDDGVDQGVRPHRLLGRRLGAGVRLTAVLVSHGFHVAAAPHPTAGDLVILPVTGVTPPVILWHLGVTRTHRHTIRNDRLVMGDMQAACLNIQKTWRHIGICLEVSVPLPDSFQSNI